MTVLPARWSEEPLGEIASLGSGGTPQAKESKYYGGNIPWAVIGDLTNGGVYTTARTISAAGLANSAAKVVPAGTILLGMYGSIGKLGIAQVPMATNQAIATIGAGDRVDGRFLFYYLLAQRSALDRVGKGAAQRNISQTVLRPWPVRFPNDLDEQWRIVELLDDHLSRLDAAEAGLRDARRRLRGLRTRLLAELHSGPTVALADLAWASGYGTSERCVIGGPGPAVVRIPNLVRGRIDLDDEKRVATAEVDVSAAQLAPGDLLIVRTNGSVNLVGRSAVVQEGIDAAFASYLIRYRLHPDRVRPEWVQAMLSAPQARRQISTLAASSAGQYNLSLAKLGPIAVPVPPLDEQDARLARLRETDLQLDRMVAGIDRAGARSAALRRSLLAAAFSGQLTAATDHPASVHLQTTANA